MPDLSPRQHWMAVLARAPAEALERASEGLLPPYTRLRGPEAGLVMLQGRAGGTGAPFNLGEATVMRCAVTRGPAKTLTVSGTQALVAQLDRARHS